MKRTYGYCTEMTPGGIHALIVKLNRDHSDFRVESIQNYHRDWALFYSYENLPEHLRYTPPDRSWVQTIPVKDAHKEVSSDEPESSKSKFWSKLRRG